MKKTIVVMPVAKEEKTMEDNGAIKEESGE